MILHFPNINPVALDIGFVQIHWYALAYVAGLYLAFKVTPHLAKKYDIGMSSEILDNFFTWAVLGVVLGGRLGYVLFYQPEFYFANPSQILAFKNGGMSFHGGLLGVFIAGYIYCRKHKLDMVRFADVWSVSTPIGLFFGRIANFINGELWGRTTDGTWGVVFPRAGNAPRHPSQLYEMFLEGIVLFILLYVLTTYYNGLKQRGLLLGTFLMGYGISRIIVEGFRQPDAFIEPLSHGTTLGQWLSVPMVFIGASFVRYAVRSR